MEIDKVVRSRYARLALAAVLIGVSAWAFAPYLSNRISASAFVNSEIIRVTTPISGRLSENMPRPGDHAAEDKIVPLVHATLSDSRYLGDLEKQHAVAKQNSLLIERQLHDIDKVDAELKTRAEGFQKASLERLTHEVAEVESETKGCWAEVRQLKDVGERTEELVRRGLTSEIRSSERQANREAVTTKCETAEARAARLRGELESAKRGIFVRDGMNDVPYSQQQRDRLFLRRQELELQRMQEVSRTSQLEREIESEKRRLNQLENFRLSLPNTHVVWSTTASPGSAVTQGQAILDLANCENKFVTVELPERDFEEIKIGSAADVRLVGSQDWMVGRVQNIRGSATSADHRLFAAQVRAPTRDTIAVEVSLPARGINRDGSFCDIGRMAEVRFPREGMNIAQTFRNIAGWLTGRPPLKVAVQEQDRK